MQDDDEINAGSNLNRMRSEQKRAGLPLEPIANNGAFDPPSSTKPYADLLLFCRDGPKREGETVRPRPSSVDGPKHVGQFQRGAAGPWCAEGIQDGISCQRPFCRRRRSVARPPRELIRWKNP